MDCLSSTAKSDLERMLFDETQQPKALPLSLLAEITDGFSDKQIIGQGGFAVVYQGMLNGGKVAVKRLSNTLMHEEFQREVVCLMLVKHKNVVRFLGYCADTQGSMERYNGKFVMADVQQRLLCFEYLPKGSLDKYITGTSRELKWRECYQIIKGICQGLHYLHEKNIVHLDLKPANILLDDNLVPKIADFGLSRCFDETQSRIFTANIGGTLGYLAPEFLNGEITYQFDLYSLGVIIIEILTGKKGYHTVDTVVESWSNKLEESQGDIQLKQVRVCTEIGIECTDFNPAKRPGTKFIIDRLDDTENVGGCIETGAITSQLEEIALNELHHRPKAPRETSFVGKLEPLQELMVFHVNKTGFEPKHLGHLTKLRELRIYNLENMHTEEAAAQAKLTEKKYLRTLILEWDIRRSSVEPGVEAAVLESLQPHGDLQVLCIRNHGGPSCPTWLGDEFAAEALQSLHLDGVSWEVFPSLGKAWDLHELRLEDIAQPKVFIIEKSFCMLTKLKLIGLGSLKKWVYPAGQESSDSGDLLPPDAHMFPLLQVLVIRDCPKLSGFPFSTSPDWFPKLQELEVRDCPEFLPVIPISWIESPRSVTMECVKMLKEFAYSESSGGAELKITGESDLLSLDQALVFDKETSLEKLRLETCPPLELKHLLMLTLLKTLLVEDSVGLVGPLGGGQSDVEWQLPIEHISISELNGNSGKELTELLPHLPKLSKLEICECKSIKKLVVGVGVQEASEMGGGEITAAAAEEEDDGVLLFPPRLCDSLLELGFSYCQELVLVDPPTLVPGGGGWLQALRSLQTLTIRWSPKFLSTFSFSCHIFPSSLQYLKLVGVEGMGTLEPLSNLSSLTRLELYDCGEDLKCQGLWSLLTTGGQLKELEVNGSPRFFADWDPNPRRALEDAEGGEEQQTQLVSSTLRELRTDDIAGLLAAPVCRFLSFSLTKLQLWWNWCEGMERFSKEQEDALQLLLSLQELEFWNFKDLQQLPAGLRNLTSLKILSVNCPAISSLPSDALSDSLQELHVYNCSEELKQYCRGLEGTIPTLRY